MALGRGDRRIAEQVRLVRWGPSLDRGSELEALPRATRVAAADAREWRSRVVPLPGGPEDRWPKPAGSDMGDALAPVGTASVGGRRLR